MSSDDIFDRKARRLRRDRIAGSLPEDRWLIARMARELWERWEVEGVAAKRALIIGYDNGIILSALSARGVMCVRADPSHCAVKGGGVQCDEDFFPFANASFDTIFWVGTLDSVNDVPGALILIRRALAPGGMFLGSFLGAGSLSTLRDCLAAPEGKPQIARHHPQIDVRAAGDLLSRAGFAKPVADADRVIARYPSLPKLVTDLRANGLGNVLSQRFPVRRSDYVTWCDRFDARREGDGKVTEYFETVQMTGYCPESAVAK